WSSSLGLRRESDDEAGAATGSILDPRLAAQRGGVLGDERQAEAGADPVPRRAPTGEALEDPGPLARGDTGARVLDHDLHRPSLRGRLDGDAGRATGVVGRVVEQVAEDPLEADPVDQRPPVRSPVDLDRELAVAVPLRDAVAQLDDVDALGVQIL